MSKYDLRRRLKTAILNIVDFDFDVHLTFTEKELTQDLEDMEFSLLILDEKTGRDEVKAKGTFSDLIDTVLRFYESWKVVKYGENWKNAEY